MSKVNIKMKTQEIVRDYRYEVKFIAYDTSYSHFLHWLKISPFHFRKFYPDRQVNSIYFDTPTLDALNENVAGISQRKKVRYRWYGENLLPTRGNLEIKHKRNNLGWKDLYFVNTNPCVNGFELKNVIKSIKKQVSNEANFYLNTYTQPVLLNRYLREYYESFDRKLRITIDKQQRFYQQNSNLNLNLTHAKDFPNIMTVEMKCYHKYRKLASEMLKDIPLRHSRYSKFVEGMID